MSSDVVISWRLRSPLIAGELRGELSLHRRRTMADRFLTVRKGDRNVQETLPSRIALPREVLTTAAPGVSELRPFKPPPPSASNPPMSRPFRTLPVSSRAARHASFGERRCVIGVTSRPISAATEEKHDELGSKRSSEPSPAGTHSAEGVVFGGSDAYWQMSFVPCDCARAVSAALPVQDRDSGASSWTSREDVTRTRSSNA